MKPRGGCLANHLSLSPNPIPNQRRLSRKVIIITPNPNQINLILKPNLTHSSSCHPHTKLKCGMGGVTPVPHPPIPKGCHATHLSFQLSNQSPPPFNLNHCSSSTTWTIFHNKVADVECWLLMLNGWYWCWCLSPLWFSYSSSSFWPWPLTAPNGAKAELGNRAGGGDWRCPAHFCAQKISMPHRWYSVQPIFPLPTDFCNPKIQCFIGGRCPALIQFFMLIFLTVIFELIELFIPKHFNFCPQKIILHS